MRFVCGIGFLHYVHGWLGLGWLGLGWLGLGLNLINIYYNNTMLFSKVLYDLIVRTKPSAMPVRSQTFVFVAVCIMWSRRVHTVSRLNLDAMLATNVVDDAPNLEQSHRAAFFTLVVTRHGVRVTRIQKKVIPIANPIQ